TPRRNFCRTPSNGHGRGMPRRRTSSRRRCWPVNVPWTSGRRGVAVTSNISNASATPWPENSLDRSWRSVSARLRFAVSLADLLRDQPGDAAVGGAGVVEPLVPRLAVHADPAEAHGGGVSLDRDLPELRRMAADEFETMKRQAWSPEDVLQTKESQSLRRR